MENLVRFTQTDVANLYANSQIAIDQLSELLKKHQGKLVNGTANKDEQFEIYAYVASLLETIREVHPKK